MMSSKICDHRHTAKQRGRPRGFDETAALEAAMRVFWRQGYAAASVDVLSRAMNVPRASLYQLFGDKERLFLAAVAHYNEVKFASVMQHLMGDVDLCADLTAFFNGVVDFATRDQAATGCLIAGALADTAGNNLLMRKELERAFEGVEQALTDRIQIGKDKGQVAPTLQADNLGMMLAATARGLMVRARTGCQAQDLYPAAKAAVDLCCQG